jgi:hypothetical protein
MSLYRDQTSVAREYESDVRYTLRQSMDNGGLWKVLVTLVEFNSRSLTHFQDASITDRAVMCSF